MEMTNFHFDEWKLVFINISELNKNRKAIFKSHFPFPPDYIFKMYSNKLRTWAKSEIVLLSIFKYLDIIFKKSLMYHFA